MNWVRKALVAGASLIVAGNTELMAQAPAGTVADTAVPRRPPAPRAQRPAVTVQNFEFSATPSNDDLASLNSLGAIVATAVSGRNSVESRAQTVQENLGRAVADLLVARLLETGQFRVLERKALDALLAEQELVGSKKAAANQTVAQKSQIVGSKYFITGAITKFSRSKQEKGAGGVLLSKIVGGVGLSASQSTYEIAVTARIVETATGEVVASVTSEGKVIGDRERALAGLGGSLLVGGAAALVGQRNSGDRERKIFEALQVAVDKLVVQFVEAKDRGDVEP